MVTRRRISLVLVLVLTLLVATTSLAFAWPDWCSEGTPPPMKSGDIEKPVMPDQSNAGGNGAVGATNPDPTHPLGLNNAAPDKQGVASSAAAIGQATPGSPGANR